MNYYRTRVSFADYEAQFGKAALKALLAKHKAEQRLIKRAQLIKTIKHYLFLQPVKTYLETRKQAKARAAKYKLAAERRKATILRNNRPRKPSVNRFRALAIKLQSEKNTYTNREV